MNRLLRQSKRFAGNQGFGVSGGHQSSVDPHGVLPDVGSSVCEPHIPPSYTINRKRYDEKIPLGRSVASTNERDSLQQPGFFLKRYSL